MFVLANAHRGYCPTEEDLGTMMDIVENLLHATLLRGESVEETKQTER